MALLEVIVAMTILVIAALSTVAWVSQAAELVVRACAAAAAADSASDYLDRIALWTREDLDRHLGLRREGAWSVTVERRTSTLYMVTMRSNGLAHDFANDTLSSRVSECRALGETGSRFWS